MNKSESKYFNTASKMDLALISLLKKKSFEYITVSEICKTAGVNRSTFYLHYENIGDLLDEAIRYLLDDFLTYFSTDIQSIALNLSDCELNELFFVSDKYLEPYLSYIKDHKEVFETVLVNEKIFVFDDVYKRMYEHVFNPILNRFDYPSEIRAYIMMYYLKGVNAVITEWLKNGCCKTTEEILAIIKICVYGLKS